MPEQLLCPGCGTPSHFEEIRRAADEFCRSCDYPLFWARSAAVARSRDGRDDDPDVRRLPGVAGYAVVATRPCWSCREANRLTATICVNCGADLDGAPPAPPPVAAPVAPLLVEPPPPAKAAIWPWIVLIVLFVTGLVLLLVLV